MVDYHDDPPRWSRIRDQAFDALKDDLILELNKHTVGLSRKNHFLPARSRKKLVTHRKLQSLSLDPSRIDLDWLVEKASTTFLITVLALDDVDSLGDALVVFRENEFNDTSLPIADLAATRIQEKQHKTQQKEVPGSVAQTYPPRSHSTTTAHTAQTELHQHSQVAKAFSGKYWNLSRLRRFYHEQWSFLVQHFDTRVFKYDIEDNRLLPFVIDTNQSTRHSGGFSDVVQAQLLGECLQTDDWLTRSPAGYHSRRISHIPVAIKELKSIDSEAYNVTHLWEAEARALAELSTPRHHNIIRCFSAFRQSNKHYFMFEWADGGSLDRFWAANHRPHLNPSRILEVLVQIRGLADALHVLHSGRRARALSSRSLLLAKANSTPGDEKASSSRSNPHSPSITLSIPDLTTSPNSQDHGDLPEDLVGSHWRHGDIKPENILRFRGPGKSKSWLGTLKLADLGSAKHHSTATQLRATVEVDYWHTMKYEPPDAYISHVTHNRSRLYDIWSLGCVFLELVTWMVWGVQGLNKVDAVTNESKAMPEGTPFWNRVGTDDATISPTASILLQTLRHHEPLCKDESALGDLVRLIEEKMLVVELPPTSKEYVKGYRANASHVLHEVNSIILRAKAESEYLFPNEVDRSRSFGTVPDIQPTGYTGLGKRQRDLDTGATLSPVTHDDSVLEQTASDIGTSHDRDTPDQHEREGELKPEVFDDLLILPPALDLDEKDDKGGTKNEITTTDISTAAVVNKRPFRARFRSKSFSHPPPKPKPQREIHATQLNIPKLNQITQIKSKMTQHFQHTLHDTWHYETDETFVNAAVDHLVTEKLRAKIFSEPTEDICDACKEFDPVSPSSFGTRTLSSLREASVYCELCAHIYTRAHKVGILSSHEVSLSRDGGVMKINGRKDTRMRICHSPCKHRTT